MRARIIIVVILALVVAGAVAVVTSRPTTPSGGTRPSAIATEGIPSGATEATIGYVHDGDTVFLGDRTKVRLLGINTPEIGDNAECYGDEATAALRALLPVGSHVWVLADVEPLDQYGRSLLFIYTDDGTNVNLELIAIGAAEVEQYRPNLLFSDELHSAEVAARAADLGLWAACY
ncbi:MAG: thermonuclease family protein [Rhodoglobus sp.]